MAKPWEETWELKEQLGQGGQGVTHRAVSLEDSSVVGALKSLKNYRNAQARGRMRREVVNLETLATAGGAVPRVLEHNTEKFKEESVQLYVVMDFISGDTLHNFVKHRQHLDIDTSVRFIRSLCDTVKLAHSSAILHRDLKPDNIMVRGSSNDQLVIVDYGLSFNITDEEITNTDETFRNRFLDLPETNTPGGDRRDARSDLTALMGIFYFCLTGNVPGHLQDGSGSLPHMRKGYSIRGKHDDRRVPILEDFFTRAFAPNIANRFQTVDEIIVKLDEFIHNITDIDESDPIQLAQSLAIKLRASDRTTQLAEFRQQAKKLFDHIHKETVKLDKKLPRFLISSGAVHGFGFGGIAPAKPIKIPDGLDLVEHSYMVSSIQVEHHAMQKHRRYAVASRGEQCVLLAAEYDFDTRKPPAVPQSEFDWQEIAWFNGDAESIYNLVSISLNEWLSEKMRELTTGILGN